MKQKVLILIAYFIIGLQALDAQTYFDGKFTISAYNHLGYRYTLYDFSREGVVMKAKYFAQGAYSQYLSWKGSKQILLVTAGAFSSSMSSDGTPVGLCVDNGNIVNRTIDNTMEGMVIIYNGGAQQGGIGVVDMKMKPVTVENPPGSGTKVTYYPKTSTLDANSFLSWGYSNGLTLFQTQLVYSSDRSTNFSNLYYGDPRERRFLAICKKGDIVHHVIVDAPDLVKLNLSASYAKTVLEYAGFNVMYIMNLDTGDKNILQVYNGFGLADMRPYNGAYPDRATIQNATNLIVYYRD